MARKDLSDVVKTVKRFGVNESNRKWSFVIVAYVTVMIFLFINALLFLINKWDKVEKRVDVFNGMMIYIICNIEFVSFIYNWDDLILLLKSIQVDDRNIGFENTPNEVVKRNEINEDINRLNTVIYYALFGNGMVMVVSPMVIIIFQIIQIVTGMNMTGDTVFTIIPLYIPENYENMTSYFILISMQSFYFLYSVKIGYVVMVPVLNCMQMISGELKLLTLMIEEMDLIIENNMRQFSKDLSRHPIRSETEFFLFPREMAMKIFIHYFVKRHCTIYRKLKEVTKRVQLIAMSQNIGFSVLLCTIVYRLVQIISVIMKYNRLIVDNKNNRFVELHKTALYETKPSFIGVKLFDKLPVGIKQLVDEKIVIIRLNKYLIAKCNNTTDNLIQQMNFSPSTYNKKTDMSIAQEALFGCVIMFCLYCYGEMGEIVSTEGEIFRMALYECQWVDKPLWFKKSLLTIMTRSNKPVEIKTYAISVLGLKNFIRMVQAAYSYYNVLKSF